MTDKQNFKEWIGKSATDYGFVSAYSANYFSLTLDRKDPPFEEGDLLPPAWH